MKNLIPLVFLASALPVLACGTPPVPSLEQVAQWKEGQREAYRKLVRKGGHKAFEAFWQKNEKAIQEAKALPEVPKHRMLLDYFDSLAAQYQSAQAGLYWYTSLEKAREVAGRDDRPVLYLRLLGKLDEEYSCANSRFFRTALYADPSVAKVLRESFILCWVSERDIPVMTIDFADGRQIVQTITGNSAHYVTSADGKVLDILPGLYAPGAFKGWLTRVSALHDRCNNAPEQADKTIAAYHQERLSALQQQWQQHLEQLIKENNRPVSALATVKPDPYTVRDVSEFWARPSSPMMSLFGGKQLSPVTAQLLMLEKRPDDAGKVNRLTASKAFVETPAMRRMRLFNENILADTLRNEHLMHRKIHQCLLSNGAYRGNLDLANKWLYTHVFRTPADDPWLGLLPEDRYFGLRNGGARVAAK